MREASTSCRSTLRSWSPTAIMPLDRAGPSTSSWTNSPVLPRLLRDDCSQKHAPGGLTTFLQIGTLSRVASALGTSRGARSSFATEGDHISILTYSCG